MDPAPSHVALVYASRRAALSLLARELDARSGRISSLRGLTFLVAGATGIAAALGRLPPAAWGVAALSGAAFVGLVVAHAVLVTRMSRVAVRVGLVERGLKRLGLDIAAFPEQGARFAEAGHPYAGDLDLFGRASLFQLLSSAQTGVGESTLAGWLLAPAGVAEVAARQAAARELAALGELREELAVAGLEAGVQGRDPALLFRFAEGGAGQDERAVEAWKKRAALSGVLVLTTLALFFAGRLVEGADVALRQAFWLPLAAQGAYLLWLRGETEPLLSAAASREEAFGRWGGLIRLIEGHAFSSARLAALRATLAGASGSDASRAIASLQRIVGFAELRQSGLVHFLVNSVLLWDIWCALALVRWRLRAGARVRGWIAAVGELEALASLATFASENPGYAWPEVREGPACFDAEGLGHPLLSPASRVTNDVRLAGPGAAMVVTGSNMSGKSTLLRSMGVNAVLALAGAPVCATSLRMAPLAVRTSMRITDSLEEGVSMFYAELARLKTLVDDANGGAEVLFLLDEILRGTNSRERRIGARAVVLHLLARGAVGAVSSHDLGLAELARGGGARVVNVHFEETVSGERMTFDYRLKPGVVSTSNALRLMRAIGIAVELPDEAQVAALDAADSARSEGAADARSGEP